jgi:hypothetical protein
MQLTVGDGIISAVIRYQTVSTGGRVTATFRRFISTSKDANLRALSRSVCRTLNHFAMETTDMYWKVAAAILIVFVLRWLARRFRDPDTYWD